MATVMIADFCGMVPLRDDILLPDNNASYANNAWLYRGQVRGFRAAAISYQTIWSDTQQVYRIPKDPAQNPPDFTSAGSIWLEYPDPFMATIRNPVVGDTHKRYYFFPSDKYNSVGDNPAWPTTSPGPVYSTLADIEAGTPPTSLGVPTPTGGAPVVTAPPLTSTLVTNASTPVGGTTLYFADASSARVGMTVEDTTDTSVQHTATAVTNAGDTILTFGSTTGVLVGMAAKSNSNPASVFAGSSVASVTPTTVTLNYELQNSVAAGDVIQFDNVNQIVSGTTVKTVAANSVELSAGVVAAGVLAGDTIEFDVDAGAQETRAYVYTYVTNNDEEGAPSPPGLASGSNTDPWTIVIPAPPAIDMAGYHLVSYRLYRTVTDSSGSASYYQTGDDIPITGGPVTIIDTNLDTTVIANKQLDTLGYTPPPKDLQGVVMMANGIAAGFTNDRDIWFSAAYLPHAWPASYALNVDYPIVGLVAVGTSLIIMTEGSPYVATGVSPSTMTMAKIAANEPCIGRGSIVASGEGGYYASPNGVQLLNPGGVISNITQQIYEKEFHYQTAPDRWAAGKFGEGFVAAIKGAPVADPQGLTSHSGFVIDATVPNVPFTYLNFPTDVTNLYSDELSGQLFGLMADGSIAQWNPPVGNPGTTTLRSWAWKTKQFRFTAPQEFKAFLTLFDVPPEVTLTPGVRNNDQAQVFNPESQFLTVKVYADGKQIVVREVQRSGEVLLIPGGLKAELWEFLFQGVVSLKFFKTASSVKELRAA